VKVIDAGRLLFPVSCAEAALFARRNLVSTHSRLRRAARLFRDPAIGGSIREESENPLVLAAGARGAAGLGPLLRELDTAAISQGRWLLLRDYPGRARCRSVIFLFRKGDRVPQMVLKIRRAEAEGPPLEREKSVLARLAEILPGDLRRVVPRVIGSFHDADCEVLVICGLPGRPLDLSMQRSLRPLMAHAESLWAAGRWLGTLHRLTDSCGTGESSVIHGDFWPRNILCERPGELSGVIDWEHAEITGDRHEDLFALPLQYVMDAPAWRSDSAITSFTDGFVRDTTASLVVSRYFDEYCAASGVKRTSIPERFDMYISNSILHAGEDPQWKARYPWQQMQSRLAGAKRSGQSG
jgi:aminoglycoside phosphotransferase